MHCFTLQDFVCVKATAQAAVQTVIVQDEPGWLDLADYQDVVLWMQITNVAAGLSNVQFQTSPTKDAFFWQTMATISAPAVGTTVTQVLLWSASIPLARYVRWQLTGNTNAAYDVTLRIVVAASAEGL